MTFLSEDRAYYENATFFPTFEETDTTFMDVFTVLNYMIVGQVVNVFGICSNIINILVFLRQRSDSVNVSLLGLALSDLASLISGFWYNLCNIPAFNNLRLPFRAQELSLPFGIWTQTLFSRITSWVTAFIALERCLCVLIPMKIKLIFTTRRTSCALILIYVLIIACDVPKYTVILLVWKHSPVDNSTTLGLEFTRRKERVFSAMFFLNNFLPSTAFVVTSVCTVVLVATLNKVSKWRQSSAGIAKNEPGNNVMSSKDRRVSVMMVLVSAVFIVCYLPGLVLFTWMSLDQDVRMEGRKSHIFLFLTGVWTTMTAINASANIFIYFTMSTNFRTVFFQMIVRRQISF